VRLLERRQGCDHGSGGRWPYSSHLHTARPSVIIAAHASTPSTAPNKIPRDFDCGASSGLRSSISVFSMRIRMVLVSWSNRLIVKSPLPENHPSTSRRETIPGPRLARCCMQAHIEPFARMTLKQCVGYGAASIDVVYVRQVDINRSAMNNRRSRSSQPYVLLSSLVYMACQRG